MSNNYNVVVARNTKDVAKGICGFAQTVAFSHYNNFSTQLPVDANGKLVSNDIKEQATQCIKNIEAIAKSIKHDLNDVVRLTVFVKSEKDIQPVIEVIKTFYKDYKPTFTACVVKDIPLNALVQIEAVISYGEGTIPNAPQAGDLIKVARNTKNAPENDYSNQTVAFSHYNHLSAQLPIDPKTNKIVSGSIKEQLNQCLRNVKNILESIDVPFDDIVKVNIYTTELGEIESIKEVYKTFFPDTAIARFINYLPALSINQVNGLMHGAKIQVEVTVSHGDGTPPQIVEDRHGIVIEATNTNAAPMNSMSSQSVAFSHYNNISEQFPINTKNEIVSKDINEQLAKCLDNLKAIVENVDHKLAEVVKLNISVKDIADISGFEQVLNKYFPESIPAGRIIATTDIGHKDALVKLDAIVSNPEGTPPTKKW